MEPAPSRIPAVLPTQAAPLCHGGLPAQEGDHPPHHPFELGDVRLESGAMLPDAKIRYVTHGE